VKERIPVTWKDLREIGIAPKFLTINDGYRFLREVLCVFILIIDCGGRRREGVLFVLFLK
jgi:hypothetical protein